MRLVGVDASDPLSNSFCSPFTLDGLSCYGVESFLHALKVDGASRRKVARMPCEEARRVCRTLRVMPSFVFSGSIIWLGSPGHHKLFERALWAKYTQHTGSREALLGTEYEQLTSTQGQDPLDVPVLFFVEVLSAIRCELKRRKS